VTDDEYNTIKLYIIPIGARINIEIIDDTDCTKTEEVKNKAEYF